MTQEEMLLGQLQGVRRRIRGLFALHGVGRLLLAVAPAVLAAVLLDYFLKFPNWLRAALEAGTIVLAAVVIVRHLWRPLRSRIRVSDVALELEGRFRQFDDRLATTVNFIESAGTERGESPAMRQAVVAETMQATEGVKLAQALRPGPVLGVFLLGLAVAGGVAGIALARPALASIGLTRLFNPLTDVQWPKRTLLVAADKSLVVIPIGEDYKAVVIADERHVIPDRVTIYYRELGADAFEREIMEPQAVAGGHMFARAFSRVRQSFEYYVEGGDDATGMIRVEARPRPKVETVSMRIVPPEYIEDRTAQVVEGQGSTRALQGSMVTMTVTTNKAIAAGPDGKPKAALRLGKKEVAMTFAGSPGETANTLTLPSPSRERGEEATTPHPALAGHPLPRERGDGRHLEAMFEVEETTPFNFALTCTDGFAGEPGEDYYLLAVEDEAPRVRFVEPSQVMIDVSPRSIVPLKIEAKDDYGVDPATVTTRWKLTARAGQAAKSGQVALAAVPGDDEAKKWPETLEAVTRWDLDDDKVMPALAVGDEVVFQGEAADRFSWRGQGPHVSKTPEYRLRVVSLEEMADKHRRELIRLAIQVGDLLKRQEDLQSETKTTRAEKKDAEPLGAKGREQATGQESAEMELKKTAESLDQQFQALLEAFQLDRIPQDDLVTRAGEVQKALGEAAKEPMPQAADALRQARSAEAKAEEQTKQLTRSVAEQQQAIDLLSAALGKLQKFTDAEMIAQELKRILSEQEGVTGKTADLAAKTLGKAQEELTAEERETQQGAERRQEELATDVKDVVKRIDETASKLTEQDPAVAQALREASKEAADRDPMKKMTDAAKEISQNQSGSAGANQKSAEEDLKAMIEKLQNRELADLKSRVQQLEALKGELDEMKKREEAHLAENKGQQAGQPNAAKPQDQASRQGQTAKDTKKLAEEIDKAEVPKAAELTQQASQSMSQAQGQLSQSQSQPAQGSQEQSLGQLSDAQKDLQEAIDQAKDQLAAKELEKIKEALTRIMEGEIKVNKATADIEGKRSDGKVARSDRERLIQTENQQKELRRETGEIVKRLKDDGEKVYPFVLGRAGDQMTVSEEGLHAAKTDAPTQTAQKKAIKILGDLTDALEDEISHRKKKPSGGGGASSSKKQPLVPSIAELKMLRFMESDIRDATAAAQEAAATGQKPAEAVRTEAARLGQEQGTVKKLTEDLANPDSGQGDKSKSGQDGGGAK